MTKLMCNCKASQRDGQHMAWCTASAEMKIYVVIFDYYPHKAFSVKTAAEEFIKGKDKQLWDIVEIDID